MADVGTDEQPVQAFRINAPPGSISALDTVSIDTRIDPETGRHIVLWSDIQEAFEGARSIRNGGRAVSFQIGKDLKKLDPRRISYYPGVILEVVVESLGHYKQVIATSTATPHNINTSAQKSNTGTHSITRQVAGLSITGAKNTHQSLALYSGDLSPEARQSLQMYSQLHGSYVEAIMSGQEAQAAIIKHSMEVHFDRLQAEIDKNSDLQRQIHELQQTTRQEVLAKQNEMLQQQEEMLKEQEEMRKEQEILRQELLEKQQQMINMQKQTLDRLVIIQSRVQAVLIQTYELHEYPIPRLFIILPKEMRFRDRLGKPFSDQFRLYFLCECGAHTMSERSKIQHEIHMAKHEGYDIDRPTEFFQKYGPYVLTMMQMIKYGVTVAGIIVPPLAHFKLVEGIEAAQKTLNSATQDIAPLVDETITYIKDQSNKADVDSESSTTVTELDRLEVLEGADLRQLESFLKIKDGSRVLGNLYRIVTLEGHVKWVCIDHYRENYRETAVQQLRDTVTANGGTFIEEKGSIEIQIVSRTRAAEFYSALVKARGIQELDIMLQWDATLDDLRKFSDAITMANILGLTVDGAYCEGPALDVINRGRRYDPLIQLASNGRLRALRFKWCIQFFSRVSTSFTMMPSQLHVLEIEIRKEDKEVDIRRVMTRILEGCQSVVDLTLKIDDILLSLSFDLVIEKLCKMKRLEKLAVKRVYDKKEMAVMRASEGRIETVEARFPSLKQIKKWEQEFIDQGLLTKVALGIDYGLEGHLLDILRRNPRISHFQIECVDASVPAVIETVTSARTAALRNGNVWVLQKLEVVARDNESRFPDITSTVEFREKDKTPIMSMNIKKWDGRYLHGSDYLNVIFSKYGSSLVELNVERTSDKHAQLLDNATKENGSKLISFELDPYLLTRVGLESMGRVIERSRSLQELGLHLDLSAGILVDKAKYLLDRYGEKLARLYLTGNPDEDWIPKVKELCPTRHRLPKLSEFRLDYRSSIPWPSLTWICTMISSPPQRSDASLSPQLSMQDDSFIPPHKSASVETRTWKSLTRIQLANFRLDPHEWRIVVRAIDFSVLKSLSFCHSNFGMDDFKMLVDRISDYGDFEVPLVTLDLFLTHVWDNSEQMKRLKTMIPLVEVKIFLRQK